MTHPYRKLSSAALLVFISLQLMAADDWPQWRGPAGQGHSDATGLPSEWDAEKNITWKTDLPGRGWSSPVIWKNQVWLTTALENGRKLSLIHI